MTDTKRGAHVSASVAYMRQIGLYTQYIKMRLQSEQNQKTRHKAMNRFFLS